MFGFRFVAFIWDLEWEHVRSCFLAVCWQFALSVFFFQFFFVGDDSDQQLFSAMCGFCFGILPFGSCFVRVLLFFFVDDDSDQLQLNPPALRPADAP